MANLEKPVPRNFTPEDVIPETVALSIGGVAGYLVGKLVNFSTPVAGALGVIGAIACALAARSRGVVGFALRKPKGEQISEVISYLSNHLGPEMTAFVSGAESPSTVGRWLAGDTSPEFLERQRLLAARQAVEELAGAYSDDMIKLWFFGKNEWLEDKAPAAVLRHGSRADDWRQLLPAAEEFAESAY